jgi:CheY-like chemotaxis protein
VTVVALASEAGVGSGQRAPSGAAGGDAGTASPTVLVAEDEESLRGMLELVLRTRGYRVLPCASGAEACDALAADGRIDLALFDLRMPGVTGLELLSVLRSDPRRAGTPAIGMSAYGDEQSANEVLTAGADAFLAKPFTIEQLTSTLDAVLRRARG